MSKPANRPLLARIGFGVCAAAFVLAAAGLFVPQGPKGSAPLYLFTLGAAGMFYIPAAFVVFWAERPMKLKPMSGWLTWIRFGMVAVMAGTMWRMTQLG